MSLTEAWVYASYDYIQYIMEKVCVIGVRGGDVPGERMRGALACKVMKRTSLCVYQ